MVSTLFPKFQGDGSRRVVSSSEEKDLLQTLLESLQSSISCGRRSRREEMISTLSLSIMDIRRSSSVRGVIGRAGEGVSSPAFSLEIASTDRLRSNH